MASGESALDFKNNSSSNQPEAHPAFCIGQHESDRHETLTEAHYYRILDAGFNFATSPITNRHFHDRVIALYQNHVAERADWVSKRQLSPAQTTNASLPGPIIPSFKDEDTALFPSAYVWALVAYVSPWIDLCSPDPIINSISRQVLNLEAAYANFCGARSIVIPGPRADGSAKGVAQFARAVQEALLVASKVNFIILMPMYREPGLGETAATFAQTLDEPSGAESAAGEEIDLFSAWDTWHSIRTICNYSPRLFVGVRLPKRMPEKALQDRWFAEPVNFLTLDASVFQKNRTGQPVLHRSQQELLHAHMRLKNMPLLLLSHVSPTSDFHTYSANNHMATEFPTLAQQAQSPKERRKSDPVPLSDHVGYLRYLERQQTPLTAMKNSALVSYQDWLQSPLQPLSDNLESATYETFESDPVKYDQYEMAITEAMADWKMLKKPCSSVRSDAEPDPALVVTVAGAGRGPLVSCVLRAADRTQTKIQLWALEKNHNAFVYLLRQNKQKWDNRVTVVKTDMRGWEGPRPGDKVDMIVSELLGSFGDNELSPECLDGVQRHLARPHGISIPQSYTAHLSPIASPRLFQDLSARVIGEPNAFEIPWVTRLFQIDFVAQKGVPGHPRFQQAWEFTHPVGISRADDHIAEHGVAANLRSPGYGSMSCSAGLNEHNTRQCHLTFVCRTRGVVHGLAGYFESILYEPQTKTKEPVELSILPEQIDRKSKDMVSWFPIFFPLKQPLYFPQDTELEVSMWRQTDDAKVWYEWMVEAYMWVGPKTRVKVGASDFHSSRKTACLM